MKWTTLYIAVTVTFLSFAFGEAQQESTDKKSEQEVRQMIKNYRTALLQRDIPALEKIWADDYVFVNASGEVRNKGNSIANFESRATVMESNNEKRNISVRVSQKL